MRLCCAVALRLAFAALPAAACSPLHLVGEATVAGLDDEELCGRRSNLLNGALMARELARRGVDCAPYDEAALRRGFHLWFLSPEPARAAAPGIPAIAEAPALGPAASLPPVEEAPPPALAAAATTPGRPEAAVPDSTPPPLDPPARRSAPAAAPGGAPTPPARGTPSAAPLVSPGCAARSVAAPGGGDGQAAAAAGRWAVAFRNTCGFPIRVLYAQRQGGGLTGATALLRPGETSPPAPIEDGLRQPGYVVCSYEAVPEGTPCRLAGGGR
jgi:hypothetical protein